MGCLVDPPAVVTATSDFPEVCVEWLPTVGPASDGDWCDITAYVAAGSTDRGRQYELDRFQAGTCSLTLKSDTRLFDPENTASPFYGMLIPMRQVRVSAVWNSVRYPVFHGFITDWGETTPSDSLFETTITAKDAFLRLEQIKVPSSAWALEVQKDDPDLWFRLGETDTVRATDSSAGGNYGLYDNVTQGADGLVVNDADAACTWPSGDEARDVRVWVQNPSLISGYPFTVSVMVKVPAEQSTSQIVFDGDDNVSKGFQICVDSDGYAFAAILNGATYHDCVSTVRIADNKPHHVAVVVSAATTILIYVDGVDRTGSSLTVGSPTWPGPFASGYSIGNVPNDYTTGVSNYAMRDGTIDEVAVWDGTAMSATRIASHSLAALNGWEGDDTGTRVGRFLDSIGWPSTVRDIDTGISILGPASWSTGTTALSILLAWADSETGAFFIGKDGKIVWRSRHFPLLDSTATTSQATFGDAHSAATLKYVDDDFALHRDEALLRNPVQASRAGGVTVTVKDQAYIEKYGDRTWDAPATEDQNDASVRDRAIWFLARYKELGTRLAGMKVKPRRSASLLWPQVLGREIGERITVKRTPLGLNSEVSVDQIIEGISHTFGPREWTTTFKGSPVDPNVGDYLILDDATYGKLDTGLLAY